jgi:hypothetical protein
MIAILGLLTADAWACSLAPQIEHEVTENPSDVVAPAVPTASVEVIRGHGPVQTEGGSQMSSSCDDIGFLDLTLASSDDVSAPEHLGFVITLVEGGQLPDGLSLSTEGMVPVRTDDGVLTISWGDGDVDEQDAFAFEVDIAAMDEAGNLGDPLRLAIAHDGMAEAGGAEDEGAGGCASAPGGAGAVALLAALAIRRRRG